MFFFCSRCSSRRPHCIKVSGLLSPLWSVTVSQQRTCFKADLVEACSGTLQWLLCWMPWPFMMPTLLALFFQPLHSPPSQLWLWPGIPIQRPARWQSQPVVSVSGPEADAPAQQAGRVAWQLSRLSHPLFLLSP